MIYDIEEINRMAHAGEEMPDDMAMPQMYLFLSLRYLYREYRKQYISREQASIEKNRAVAQCEYGMFQFNCYLESAIRGNRISSALLKAQRDGCPICKDIVKIYDGRLTTNGEETA